MNRAKGVSTPARETQTPRVLVLGGSGMLGHKLCQTFAGRFDVYATFRRQPSDFENVFAGVKTIEGVDAADLDSVRAAIRSTSPNVAINAIGIVKQRAESKSAALAITVNSLLPHVAFAACREIGSQFIQVSTDCVFSGRRGDYREDDIPDPIDLYGRSKLLGEVDDPDALTIRTSIIGRELQVGRGLLEWFFSQAGGKVRGYANAIFSGLTTLALANVLAALIEGRVGVLSGVWHVSSTPIDKFTLLRQIDAVFGTGTEVERDEDYRCNRSLNSERFWSTTGLPQPTWPGMLSDLVADPTAYRQIRAGQLRS